MHKKMELLVLFVIIVSLTTNAIPMMAQGYHSVYGDLYIDDVLAPSGVEVKLSFPTGDESDFTNSNGYYQIDFEGHDWEEGEFSVNYAGDWYIPVDNQSVEIEPDIISYNIDLHIETVPHPDTVYVDDDFNESTPGWGYDHFDSIQDGVDGVNESGTVYVYNGTYYEHVWVDKSINLIGEDKNNTIIDGNKVSDVIIRILVDSVNINGFTIQESGNGYSGVCTYANNTNISNNIVKSNGYHGITVRTSNNNTFSNNIVFGNKQGGINLQDSSSYNVISRNTISSHDNYGIRFQDSSGNNTIYHNNLVNNTQNGYDVSTNTWYSEALGEGNYYDDYNGTDADGDGIGDIPYNISGGDSQDHYPLMHHFELYYILNISAPPEVNEGEMFNVVVTSIGGPVVPNAIVEFNDELKLTDSDGRVYFTAPQVGEDTYYDIIANREGYTGDTETILVKDMPVEFVSTFIFGRIDNLTTGGDVITFEAVNIRCVTFFPFTYNAYTSGELITISKNPKGFVGALFGVQLIFAFCGLKYQPSTSTISMNKFSQDDFANTVIWLVSGVEGNPMETKDVEMILLNESGEAQPDAEITFNEVNVEGYINPGDTFTVIAPSDGYYIFMLTHKISGATIYKSSLTHY